MILPSERCFGLTSDLQSTIFTINSCHLYIFSDLKDYGMFKAKVEMLFRLQMMFPQEYLSLLKSFEPYVCVHAFKCVAYSMLKNKTNMKQVLLDSHVKQCLY